MWNNQKGEKKLDGPMLTPSRRVSAVQSIWATVWKPILNNYLYLALRWKNTSLLVWSEEVSLFEDSSRNMSTDQIGLTNMWRGVWHSEAGR